MHEYANHPENDVYLTTIIKELIKRLITRNEHMNVQNRFKALSCLFFHNDKVCIHYLTKLLDVIKNHQDNIHDLICNFKYKIHWFAKTLKVIQIKVDNWAPLKIKNYAYESDDEICALHTLTLYAQMAQGRHTKLHAFVNEQLAGLQNVIASDNVPNVFRCELLKCFTFTQLCNKHLRSRAPNPAINLSEGDSDSDENSEKEDIKWENNIFAVWTTLLLQMEEFTIEPRSKLDNFKLEILRFCESMMKHDVVSLPRYSSDKSWVKTVCNFAFKIMVLIAQTYKRKTIVMSKNTTDYGINENFIRRYPAQRTIFNLNYFQNAKIKKNDNKKVKNQNGNLKIFSGSEIKTCLTNTVPDRIKDILKLVFKILHLVIDFNIKSCIDLYGVKINKEFLKIREEGEVFTKESCQELLTEESKLHESLFSVIKTNDRKEKISEYPRITYLYSKFLKYVRYEELKEFKSLKTLMMETLSLGSLDEYCKQLGLMLISRAEMHKAGIFRKIDRTAYIANPHISQIKAKISNILYKLSTNNSVSLIITEEKEIIREIQNELNGQKFVSQINDTVSKFNLTEDNTKAQSADVKKLMRIVMSVETLMITQFSSVDTIGRSLFNNLKVYDALMKMIINQKEYCVSKVLEQFVNENEHNLRKIKLARNNTFQNVFAILGALTFGCREGKIVLWKYKEILVLPDLKQRKGYGELYVVNEILDDQLLLTQAHELHELTAKVLQRRSIGNLEIILTILSKITTVCLSREAEAFTLGVLDNNLDLCQLPKLPENLSPTITHKLTLICLNFLNRSSIPNFTEIVLKHFPIDGLYQRMWNFGTLQVNTFLKHSVLKN